MIESVNICPLKKSGRLPFLNEVWFNSSLISSRSKCIKERKPRNKRKDMKT